MQLVPRTKTIYDKIHDIRGFTLADGSSVDLARHLVKQGWTLRPPRSQAEQMRLEDGRGGLLVLYRHGVLVQGKPSRGLTVLWPLLPIKWQRTLATPGWEVRRG